jgi:acyl-CoA synthetase (NDP forming)
MTAPPGAPEIIARYRAEGRKALAETDGKRLLAASGIAVPRSVVVRDAASVPGALAGLTPPFAAKVLSEDILHKSDAGGVRLGLNDAAEVAAAIEAMMQVSAIARARLDGFLIEEMAPSGTEIVVGALRDPQFGPAVMVGLGGVFVEVLKDVAFRICPITEADAEAMLDGLRGAALLTGARGKAPVDRAALVRVLMQVGGPGGLMLAHPEIAEIDINPIIAGARGLVAVDARFILSEPGRQAEPPPPATKPGWLAPLFAPRAIAVYGASATSASVANTFIRRTREFGFSGPIYPIHPTAPAIEGLPAYPDLSATPEPVDYAYIAIGARNIPGVLERAGGRLKFAQVISSGFAEVEDGQDLQRKLVEAARAGGSRVLGPNCLGLYSPRGGVTFPTDAPKELGSVGVITQSGGLGTDIIKRGQYRGLRFSGLVTIGNSADVSPSDLLRFYFTDPHTRVIGLYLEDIKDGRAFFDLMRSPEATKPVVILRGGRSEHGRAAAASHTGALAGSGLLWEALAEQSVCVLVETVDEFIDTLLALQFFDLRADRPTNDVVLFGNGGGTSVLGTDFFAGVGLSVAPFGDAARTALEALNLPPGTSVANPIDAPVRTLQEQEGRIANEILERVYRHASLDALVMHINLAAFAGRAGVDPIENLFQAAVSVQKNHPGRAHFAVALRSDGSPELDDRKRAYRTRALAAGIPVYDEIAPAAQALRCVRHLEIQLSRRARATTGRQ